METFCNRQLLICCDTIYSVIKKKKNHNKLLTMGQATNLGNAYGVLGSTADEVKLSEPPHLDGPIRQRSTAHRLVEGVAASLTRGGAHPLQSQR